MTQHERYKKWFEKLKSNPARYKKYKNKNNIARKKYYYGNIKANKNKWDKYMKHRMLITEIERFGRPRKEILNEWGNKCAICSSVARLCIHHINNRGRNTPKEFRDNRPESLS